jgi:hypothetical protein|tara:strand:+ start:28 stop:546 length:519 start_codon:yes stop_codon:yes gene_type:complete
MIQLSSVQDIKTLFREKNCVLMECNVFGIHIYRITFKLERFFLPSYVLIHIPAFNIFVLVLKGFLLYNQKSSIANAYKQYKKRQDESYVSLENNFYTIHDDDDSDNNLDVYCVDDNDPMIHHLYSFFSEYELRVTSMDRILHNEMEQKLKKILLHPISIDLEEYDNNDNESY